MGALKESDSQELCVSVNKTGHTVEEFCQHVVRGNVMSPTLPGGSVCLIDMSDRQIESGNLYCLTYPVEGNVIRRLFRQGKEIIIKCDNPVAPEFRIDDEKLQSKIVGRVKAGLSLFK